MKKTLLALLLLIGAIVGLSVWKERQPKATVAVVRPATRTIQAYVEEQAVTSLPRDYLVSMPINGWLKPIDLREGDRVYEGRPLASMDTEDLDDKVAQAQQRIASIQAKIAETKDHRLENNALVQAKASVVAIEESVKAAEAQVAGTKALRDFRAKVFEEVHNLAVAGGATAQELRKVELELKQAEANLSSDRLDLAAMKTIAAVSYIGPKFIRDFIDRKRFTLEQHEKELAEAEKQLAIEQRNRQRATVYAPVDGVVLARHQTSRQYLTAGTALLTLGRLEDMEVIAEVLTDRAMSIAPGDRVELFGRGLTDSLPSPPDTEEPNRAPGNAPTKTSGNAQGKAANDKAPSKTTLPTKAPIEQDEQGGRAGQGAASPTSADGIVNGGAADQASADANADAQGDVRERSTKSAEPDANAPREPIAGEEAARPDKSAGSPDSSAATTPAKDTIEGVVRRVYPAGFEKVSSLGVEQRRVKVAITLKQRPPRLGVGFRVHVRIFHDEARDALSLPRTCLTRNAQGGWQVLTVEGERIVERQVQVGLMNEELAQITAGLSPSDRVVTRPSRELEAGMRVKVER